MNDHCILCGRPLAPDRRWRIIRTLSPRFPRCDPPDEACYRGLAARIGAHPTDEEVRANVIKTQHHQRALRRRP